MAAAAVADELAFPTDAAVLLAGEEPSRWTRLVE